MSDWGKMLLGDDLSDDDSDGSWDDEDEEEAGLFALHDAVEVSSWF